AAADAFRGARAAGAADADATAAGVRRAAAERAGPGTGELRARLRSLHVRAWLLGALMSQGRTIMSRVALVLAVLGVLMVAVAPPSVPAAGRYDRSSSVC